MCHICYSKNPYQRHLSFVVILKKKHKQKTKQNKTKQNKTRKNKTKQNKTKSKNKNQSRITFALSEAIKTHILQES